MVNNKININTLVYGDLNYLNSYSQIDENMLSDIAEWGKDKLDHFVENLKLLVTKHKKTNQSLEEKLRSHGVNVEKLHSLAKKVAKKHVFKIDRSGNAFINMVKSIGEDLNSGLNEILPERNSFTRQALVGVLLLAFAFCFNTALDVVGYGLFGPVGGSFISACLGAPISEELGKIVSINQDAGDAYFLIFNAAEWSLYVKRSMAAAAGMAAGGTVIAVSVLIRFICVGFHYALTKIHEAHSSDEKSREKGLKMGMMFHALWNFIAHFPVVGLIQMPIMLYLIRSKYSERLKKNKR